MAKIDISDLLDKRDDDPSNAGRLTAKEWKLLVQAVQENQTATEGVVKSVNYNGTLYNTVSSDGVLTMTVASAAGREPRIEALEFPDPETGSHYISSNESCTIKYVVKDYKVVNGENVPVNTAGKVNYYINGSLVETQNRVFAFDSQNYTGPTSFDFSKYGKLTTSNEGNELKIEYINDGISTSEIWYVWLVDISLSVTNVNTIYTTNDLQKIKYAFYGYQKYFIYAKIDDTFVLEGKECDTSDDEYIYGSDDLVTRCNTHGVHTLRIWAEMQIPDTTFRLATPVQEFTYIFGDVNNYTPVVMTNLLSNSEYELYNNLEISYFVYLSSANEKKSVNISLISTDKNKVLFETNQEVQFTGDKYEGTHTFSLFPSTVSEDDIIGNSKISLSVDGNAPFEVPVVIKPSSILLTQEKNYYAYFTAQGKSNTADDARVWESKHSKYPSTPVITDVTFENVNFNVDGTGSGWSTTNGITSMHLKRGSYFTVNYKPFESNPVYTNNNYGTGNGLTISIEFATRNCLNANAKVIDCMDNNIGFYVTAGNAYLKSDTTNLSTAFKEDTRIKLDIVIEDKLRNYKYTSATGKGGTLANYDNDQSYAIMFVDGVYSGVSLIGPNTTFKQDNPKFIKFGSADCDLDVYSIRIYDKALSVKNIVDNYSYDTPDIAQKMEIARRNMGILSENTEYPFMPKINIERTRLSNGSDGGLKVARPNLPIFYFTQDTSSNDILPNTKDGDGVKSFTQFVNPLHNSPISNTEAMSSFEMSESGVKNQGTSSMNYPWPWRNLDWKPLGDKTFYMPTLGSNVSGSKWYQYPYKLQNSNIGIKKITLKKDYASSEMCNNAITSEYFTDMAIGIYDQYVGESDLSSTPYSYNPGVLSPAMYDDITTNSHTDLRLALKSLPCFCIQKLTPGATDSRITPNTADNNFAIGMMNLIPNKNEVGYLGFKKNKWENSDEGITTREQSWELSENYEDVYWVKPFEYLHLGTDGKYVSDLDGYYEARTPKDSVAIKSDFGILDDNSLTADQVEKLYDEQKDIIDFHNWACSVDRGNATNKPLKEVYGDFYSPEWNVNPETGEPYTTDSADFRFAKFKGEAEKYLLIDQWILYYIWREQFWMYDSGFKNLQIYTVGTNPKYPDSGIMQWGCMVRDADTALGIQNVGEIVFPPHLEDIDYGVQEGDDENGSWTFYYNGAKDVYSVNQLKEINANAKSVLNGQFGSLWLNIRDAYSSEIEKMYNKLTESRTLKFNAENVIDKFRKHQENWSESLYNFGLRQYIGGELFTANLKAACGDKKHSRAQWLERSFYYRASKYKALGDDKFSMRAATYETTPAEEQQRGDSLRIKTYIPMYLGMGGSSSANSDVKSHVRIVDVDSEGNYYRDIKVGNVEDGFRYTSSADTNNYIFGISMITDLDDLARHIKITNIQDLKNAPKLRKLQFGHEPARDGVTYQEMVTENGQRVPKPLSNGLFNQAISLNTCPQLEVLDFTNHYNLAGLSIDKCLQLKELYLRGTNKLTTLTLPKTSTLETLYLGDRLTALDLSGLSNLKTLVIDGLSNCTQLTVENSGEYISGIKSFELMKSVINNPGLNRLILKNINWDLGGDSYEDAVNYLKKILDLRKQYGKENITLTGKIQNLNHLSNDLKVELCNPVYGFGDIDSSNNSLEIKYTHVAIDPARTSIMKKWYVYSPNTEYQLSFSTNTDANTYKSATWTLDSNADDYATIDSRTGVITRNEKPATDNTPGSKLTVVIEQIPHNEGDPRPTITLESMVYFYERIARPGDIVFNDGTFGDELDPTKKPIGVCFYVDPDDKNKRLMSALEPIRLSSGTKELAWGVDKMHSNPISGKYYGPSPYLEVNGSSYNYDLPEIRNINNAGLSVSITSTENYFSDDNYRDSTDAYNKYFKKFGAATWFGDLGWITPDSELRIDGLGDGNQVITLPKSGESIDETYVPVGYYKTLAIIQNRNKLLDAYKNTENQKGAFARPLASNNYTELEELSELLSKANNWNYAEWTTEIGKNTSNGTFGAALYYPAASACFAYEPAVNNLSSKFKKYNWFLPSSGELLRLLYYIHQSKGIDSPENSNYNNSYKDAAANAFDTAIKLDVIRRVNFTSGGDYFSSTEADTNNAVRVSYERGYATTKQKGSSNSVNVIPVCAF